jgi:hypothetical protein
VIFAGSVGSWPVQTEKVSGTNGSQLGSQLGHS